MSNTETFQIRNNSRRTVMQPDPRDPLPKHWLQRQYARRRQNRRHLVDYTFPVYPFMIV